MIEPDDIYAGSDVVEAVSREATEGFGFEHAIAIRRALQHLISRANAALSDVESEMVRQVERNAKTVNGVTYARGARKTSTADHERILSTAYSRALVHASRDDGSVDWQMVGEAMRDLVVSLYLSPSSQPKVSGLEHIGLKRKDVTTETIKGWKLLVLGEEQ